MMVINVMMALAASSTSSTDNELDLSNTSLNENFFSPPVRVEMGIPSAALLHNASLTSPFNGDNIAKVDANNRPHSFHSGQYITSLSSSLPEDEEDFNALKTKGKIFRTILSCTPDVIAPPDLTLPS
jgi:hypothetical protein